MTWNQILGIVISAIGAGFSLAGVIILYKYKGFYIKAATTSLIDSTGFILIILGIIVYSGISFISFKVILLLLFVMMLNPLSNHYIVKGAYRSGYKDEKDV
ncbi:MAG: hypothetical protein CSB16_02790 [Clostridiales bacterium]|nr:MAG: hypothetical protein CSB16_02790 [Clostridiales bacterium]